MKRFPVMMLLIMFISFSCTKTGVQISRNDISGTWVLKNYSGGLAGGVYTPTDNSTLTFEKAGTYSSATNFAITGAGRFTITKAGTPNYYFSETLLNLFPSNSSEINYGLRISNDSLFLDEGCCDRFSYTYVKQK